MSEDDHDQTSSEDTGKEQKPSSDAPESSEDDHVQTSSEDTGDEQKTSSDMPELSEEGKEKVQQMAKAYEDRETAILPGTGRTITGTAVNEWLDDEGNPKFGKEEQQKREQEQEQDEQQGEHQDAKQEGEQQNA